MTCDAQSLVALKGAIAERSSFDDQVDFPRKPPVLKFKVNGRMTRATLNGRAIFAAGRQRGRIQWRFRFEP